MIRKIEIDWTDNLEMIVDFFFFFFSDGMQIFSESVAHADIRYRSLMVQPVPSTADHPTIILYK